MIDARATDFFLAEFKTRSWITEASFYSHGLPCIVTKDDVGIRCGYIYITPEIREQIEQHLGVNQLVCHGGITYNSGNVIGFDCAHAGDLELGLVRAIGRVICARDTAYVIESLEGLARQITAIRIAAKQDEKSLTETQRK